MSKLITVSPSPHVYGEDSVKKLMYGVVFALLPALAVSVYYFGIGAIVVTITAILSCAGFEYVIQKYLMKETPSITDGSAMLTGLLLAFNVPSNLPIWMIVVGSLVAIGVGKMTFGGLGNNPFNPALVGRVFLLISFPVHMTMWPAPEVSRDVNWLQSTVEKEIDGKTIKMIGDQEIDAVTCATPLGIIKNNVGSEVEKITAEGDTLKHTITIADIYDGKVVLDGEEVKTFDKVPEYSKQLLGNIGGSLGEVSVLALLLGGLFMLFRRIITWHIPVTILVTSFVFAGILHLANPEIFIAPEFHLMTGGMMLGAIFMATDYVTSPMTPKGMYIYGIGIGVLTILIRVFGAYPEGMSFAILIMNGFVPLLNAYIKPKRFGEVVN